MDVSAQFEKKHAYTLIYAAFIAGLCSIIYELLIATTAAYFLGDSVKYFSLTIGIYMAAMGVGSYISKYFTDLLLHKFIVAELLLAVFGGLSIPVLYLAYAYTQWFLWLYFAFTFIIGLLVGLEIPLLTRLMERYNELRFNIANILSFDYIGALIATVSFPFILLPVFGVYQSSLLFGLVNLSIGFAVLWVFSHEVGRGARKLKLLTALLFIFLLVVLIFAEQTLKQWDDALYEDRVVYSEQTPYQRIILTKYRDDVRLYLDGNLQLSSRDEYRYHEALVHVPYAMRTGTIKRVLLLGAGDGAAVRELLKYPQLEEIILVDLDPAVVKLARSNPYLKAINRGSLESAKVHLVQGDAFRYLVENTQGFDYIVADLPDPNNTALARLYSKQFYKLIQKNLTPKGVFVTQATSPYFAREAFWSIKQTLQASGFPQVKPYHVSVPSFGEWGFIVASEALADPDTALLVDGMRFLHAENIRGYFQFPKDIDEIEVSINHMDTPKLLHYYLKGWRYYAR